MVWVWFEPNQFIGTFIFWSRLRDKFYLNVYVNPQTDTIYEFVGLLSYLLPGGVQAVPHPIFSHCFQGCVIFRFNLHTVYLFEKITTSFDHRFVITTAAWCFREMDRYSSSQCHLRSAVQFFDLCIILSLLTL